MIVYLAKIHYPYDESESLHGVYSTEEKAQSAVEKELLRYQRLSNRTDAEMKRIPTGIEEYEVDSD